MNVDKTSDTEILVPGRTFWPWLAVELALREGNGSFFLARQNTSSLDLIL